MHLYDTICPTKIRLLNIKKVNKKDENPIYIWHVNHNVKKLLQGSVIITNIF